MIESEDGRFVYVDTFGEDVVLEWVDPVGRIDGDMLLSPKNARALADRLYAAARLADK